MGGLSCRLDRAGNLIFNQHSPIKVNQKLQFSLDFIRRWIVWLYFVLAPFLSACDLACTAVW